MEELDGWAARPEAETSDFVLRFEVGHADFEDGGRAVAALCGCDERARDIGTVEGWAEVEGPSILEGFDGGWETVEPSHAFGRFLAVGRDGDRDAERHVSIVAAAWFGGYEGESAWVGMDLAERGAERRTRTNQKSISKSGRTVRKMRAPDFCMIAGNK